MRLNSAQAVMAVARARGFSIILREGPPPMPMLAGRNINSHATPALMEALKAWRVEIIAELRREQSEPKANA